MACPGLPLPEPGQMFGRWTVLEEWGITSDRSRRPLYLCVCACERGEMRVSPPNNLRAADKRDGCPCLKEKRLSENGRLPRDRIPIGRRQGQLTIIDSRYDSAMRSTMLLVQCDCGSPPRWLHPKAFSGAVAQISCGCRDAEYGGTRKTDIPKTSKFKGVHRQDGGWVARVKKQGQSHYLGTFRSERDAAIAYDKKAVDLFGTTAMTNERMGLL